MGIRQTTFLDYEGFLDKFTPKKTTDDCYTPANVYEAVRAWAVREYGLEGREIVRPFWPGGDYQSYEYAAGCVVIDNPPFSILGKIVRWYAAARVDYFLFSPYLTNLGVGAGEYGVNHIIAPCSVVYENGAEVDTAFVTNLGDDFIRSAPDLMDAIETADNENRKNGKRTLPKYVFPYSVVTSAAVGYLCKRHTPLTIRRKDCAFVRKLDAMGSTGIFGGGYILSERAAAERAAAERAAAERAAAERAAAERAAATTWTLSPRELEIQRMLGATSSNEEIVP